VIPTKQKEILRVFDLVGKEQTNRLQRLLAPIDIVAKEQVVRLGRESAVLEQSQQVRVLAVNIAANLQRRLQLEQNWLRQKNLARFDAQGAHLGLGHLDRFAGSTAAHFKQSIDHFVYVEIDLIRHDESGVAVRMSSCVFVEILLFFRVLLLCSFDSLSLLDNRNRTQKWDESPCTLR